MRFTLSQIPVGEAGTDATVKRIIDLVRLSLQKPSIRLKSLAVLRASGVFGQGPGEQARALCSWVQRNIDFVRDPVDVETVQQPEVTLKLKAGDCDDHVGLIAALLQSIGLPVRLVVLGVDRDSFQHIYAEVFVDGSWRAADTTGKYGIKSGLPGLVRKVYSLPGDENMIGSLSGGEQQVVPLRVSDAKRLAYNASMRVLNHNWQQGLIDRSDLIGCLRVVGEPDSPSRGTVLEEPMRKAVEDFLLTINQQCAPSHKTPGRLSGLGGVNGFFDDVWNAAKNSVKAGVDALQTGIEWGTSIFGGGSANGSYDITPTISVQPQIPPSTMASGVGAVLSSPVVLGLGLVAVVLLLKGKR